MNFFNKFLIAVLLFTVMILTKNQISSTNVCTRPNEVYVYGASPPCQRYCSQLNRDCCLNTLLPVNGCFCKNGFARNEYGICTPINSRRCCCLALPRDPSNNCATIY